MKNAQPKITLSRSEDIPFHKLVLSQSNVRRIKAGISVEDLAEDIARRGLLQSICVRPVREADGTETGLFEIPAGGLRIPTKADSHSDRKRTVIPIDCGQLLKRG